MNPPEGYGVVEFDDEGRVASLEKKATEAEVALCSNRLYFYDNLVVDIAKSIKPSARGETGNYGYINQHYVELGQFTVEKVMSIEWLLDRKSEPVVGK